MTSHPLLRELQDSRVGAGDVKQVLDHLVGCLACRVRIARIAQADELETATPNVVQQIFDASSVVPGATDIPIDRDEREPEPGELWRVGRDEALLAWVRKNFHDGAVDVVPVVLDVELADEQALIIAAELSPLAFELAAMVAVRTHVHRDAFINRLGTLDISADIEDVIAATREKRDTTATVGPRIEFDDDDRIEYRQALRDLLDELSPSNWPTESSSKFVITASASSVPQLLGSDLNDLRSEIHYRIRAAQCMDLPSDQFDIARGRRLGALFKVAYLNTAVVVVSVESLDDALSDQPALLRACKRAMESSPDADAVCVAESQNKWGCVLYSCASMRGALELPGGRSVGPAPILTGYGVVDTLSKHLEGAAPAWELTDRPPPGLGSINMTEISSRHALSSLAGIQSQGRAARQAAKKSTWTTLPAGLEERVSRLITAVMESVPIDDALTEFRQGSSHD